MGQFWYPHDQQNKEDLVGVGKQYYLSAANTATILQSDWSIVLNEWKDQFLRCRALKIKLSNLFHPKILMV